MRRNWVHSLFAGAIAAIFFIPNDAWAASLVGFWYGESGHDHYIAHFVADGRFEIEFRRYDQCKTVRDTHKAGTWSTNLSDVVRITTTRVGENSISPEIKEYRSDRITDQEHNYTQVPSGGIFADRRVDEQFAFPECEPITFTSKASTPIDPSKCQPQARVTPDNDMRIERDIRSDGKLEDVPASVLTQIRTLATDALAHVNEEDRAYLDCKFVIPNPFRINIAGGLQLFIAEVSLGGALGGSFFHFILYDPTTGRVTANPPAVGSKWPQLFGAFDPLVYTPFVSSADLFGNHRPQIVFEERVHNGTVYNGVVYHYFDVGPNLELTRVLALETRVLPLDPRKGLLVRELTQLEPGHLRITMFEQSNRPDAQRKELGFVNLQSDGPGIPFRVVDQHVEDRDYDKALVTFMGSSEDPRVSDDSFLRDGYTGYY